MVLRLPTDESASPATREPGRRSRLWSDTIRWSPLKLFVRALSTRSCWGFELGYRLQRVLDRARQDDPSLVLLQLPDGDRDVVLSDAEKLTGADDGVGQGRLRRDDQLVDHADLLVLVVVHPLPRIFFFALQPTATAF